MTSSLRPLNWLNCTQFLGAANDNLLKFSMVFLLIESLGKAAADQIQTAIGICFVLPFLMFSPFAGFLADRHSKQRIMVITKIAEIMVTILAYFAFRIANTYLLYAVLFLMATHSAFFGPSKYGSIPELVPSSILSRANGLINGFTYLAIIFGTLTAPLLTEWLHPHIDKVVIFCIAIACLGLISSINIPMIPAVDPQRRWNKSSVFEIVYVLRRLWQHPPLFQAILASTLFWFLGAFIQIAIIPYGFTRLQLLATESTYLYLVMAIGIGLGSLATGYCSGSRIRLNLLPIGLIGMTGIFAILGIGALPLPSVYVLLFVLGIAAGIYIVPINTYIQALCPKNRLGEVMAAENFLSFVGILLAALLFGAESQIFRLNAAEGFVYLAAITMLYGFYLWLQRSHFHQFKPLLLHEKTEAAEVILPLPDTHH
jgi:acyl-[acyl-carrier-protein]-phospholipid O-acyltransferase/long-chain-fatty-acid--[acyl-carrier-protein] ligase